MISVFSAQANDRTPRASPFEEWLGALEERHLARLHFSEVRRAAQALSCTFVERRERIPIGALRGAGKRAAFALFYGPLHFLLVRNVVRALEAAAPAPRSILDLGCGTGAAGAAWALEVDGRPAITAVDRSRWAVEETRWTFRQLGLKGRAVAGDVTRASLPGAGGTILAAFTVNELEALTRERLLKRLLAAAHRGARVLIVEPIARRATPWWGGWSEAFERAGGRADDWRFPARLPERLKLLDRAAGLDHRELTARSLWLPHGSQET
ncbi:MAG: methyltransferase domain-containing protein [Acidobacteriota bacterium]